MYDISDLRILQREQKAIAAEMKENEILSNPESRNPEGHMRSLSIEQDIIQKVQQGDVDGLIDGATKIPAVRSGQLAPQLLRHHKNFFIRLETIISRAAIQAGLPAEEVLETEERYISKCESLPDMERIKNLQYHMILDYADQVRKLKQCGGSQSRLVRNVLQYIRSHMAEPIRTADIAAYCGKSRGGLTMEFKKQTIFSIPIFIISGIIGIFLAYMGYGVWALVLQGFLSSVLTTVALWYFVPWKPSLEFSWKSFHSTFGFGCKLMISSLLDSCYRNAYQFVIAKRFSAADLGYYTRANTMARLPMSSLYSITVSYTHLTLPTILRV